MLLKLSIALAAAALVACPAAWAAPATVQLRVEGSSATIFEGPVTTDGKTIDKGGGPHPCDGTNGGANPAPGPTMTSSLDDASVTGAFTWDGTWFDFGDFGIDRVGPDASTSTQFWGYALNYLAPSVGGCQQQVKAGDEVLYAFDFFGSDFGSRPLLSLSGPATNVTGQPLQLSVVNGTTGAPIAGAQVADAVTGADGSATAVFDSSGLRTLKAEKDGAIRSNALRVCASTTGADTCGVPVEQLGTPSAGGGGQARDARAPEARIAGPRSGARYRRGPRLLRGTARDAESGVTTVKLALRRHVRGKPCRWWSGRRERFVGTHCRKVFFFAIGDDADWSYLLPQRLPPGRYVLDVKAFDRARNRDERFVRGRNRAVFDVLGARTRRKAAASRARPARVSVMVVGRAGVVAAPRTLRASAVRVRVGARRCRVAASTPLAALARALSRKGTSYSLRDFGRCSRQRAADSGQLFVDRVGGDRNSGSDGWFYKVDHRAGTAGGADPLGPLGRGRLRDGDEVLWFYCVHDERSGSCQRSLGLSAPRRLGESGERVSVSVRAFDNEARGRSAAGATVTLGAASSLADALGVARLVLPGSGRYTLAATGDGMLPSFPLRVEVGAGG